MAFSCNNLRAIILAALVAPGCADVAGGPEGAGDAPAARLSLRANSWPELTGRELTVTAEDSVIIRASVEGNPEAYGVPVLAASIPAALELRGDGSAAVRYPAPLVLTATATAKAPSTRPATLSAAATLNLACTMEARPGIALTLLDSVSGQPVSGTGGLRLRATSGTWADSLVMRTIYHIWSTAHERRGTYSVTADVDGYRPWRADGIVVTGGLCHVHTTPVVARLTRN